jgi:glycosyltransferase 2 family protein
MPLALILHLRYAYLLHPHLPPRTISGAGKKKTKDSMAVSGNRIRLIAGCLIGAAFLYLAFRKVDFAQMWDAFSRANYWYFLVILVVMFISHWLRVLRWRLLLDPIKRLDIGSLFSALIIGYMANVITPAHLGELLRAYILGKKRSVSASSALATIVVERILDVFALLAIMVLAIFLYPFPGWVKSAGYLMLAGTLGLFLFLILLKKSYERVRPFLELLLRPVPTRFQERIWEFIDRFIEGIVPLKARIDYVIVLVHSVLIWACYGLILHLSLQAFDFYRLYHLPWLSALILLVITTIGVVVPSSPGYVGTYHYLCQVSLGLFAVPSSPALSFAAAVHAISFFPVLVAGLILSYYEGLGFLTSGKIGRLPTTDQ